jgi:hypothetical protein
MWKKQDERFLKALIDTRGQLDEVTDRYVRVVLLQGRLRRAAAPYAYVFKLAWEIVRGRYWKSSSKVHGGANQASGGGPGAGGQPVSQTGYSAFTGAVFAGAGAGVASVSAASPVFEDAGIVAGEVVAYRCWFIKEDGLLYSDVMRNVCWKPGEVLQAGDGDLELRRGIHAFKSPILACQFAGTVEGYVTGTVDLWGEVYEHDRGYRAQFAAVRSIDDSPYYDAKALRKLYGLNKRKKKGLPRPEA